MKYLWDTDTCVYFLNGNVNVLQKTGEIGIERISTSLINIYELKFGAYNSARVRENLKRIDIFRGRIKVLDDFSDEIGTFFADGKAKLRKKGITVSDFDLLIAGFAAINGLCLVTNNIKHFKNIPGLEIENWAVQ